MIILLSGGKKYSVEGEALELVNAKGRALFEMLERNELSQFKVQLQALHSFVMENGVQTDPYRNADIVIPSINCDASELRSVFSLHK